MIDLQHLNFDNTRIKVEAIQPPAQEPVTPTELGQQLNLTQDEITDEQGLLNTYIQAARQHVESLTDQRLITQKFINYFNFFESVFKIYYPPIQNIEEVRYINDDRRQTIVPADTYVLSNEIKPAELTLADGKTYPSDTLGERNVIEVEVVSGFGDNPEDVPAPLRHAIILKAAQFFEQRTPGIEEKNSIADNLIAPYRVRPI